MIRRILVQNSRRRQSSVMLPRPRCSTPHTSSISTTTRTSSAEAIRCQFDINTSAIPPTSASSSSGFEIQGISARILSSEAIIAPLELYKTLSTLNRQSSSDCISDNIKSTLSWHGLKLPQPLPPMDTQDNVDAVGESEEYDKQKEEDIVSFAAAIPNDNIEEVVSFDEQSSEHDNGIGVQNPDSSQLKKDVSEEDVTISLDDMKQKMNDILDRQLQGKSRRGYRKVSDIFHEVRQSPYAKELLDENQLLSIFHYLIHHDVPASYNVLKYHVQQCKEEGRLVKLELYQRIIHRCRPVAYNQLQQKTPYRGMGVLQLESLVKDMIHHIQQEYGEGKKMVYQYILLTELVVALTDNKNTDVSAWAIPLMNYILDSKFPVLDPELYEYILSKGRRSDLAKESISTKRYRAPEDEMFPYHRVLSMLISSGHTPQPEAVMTVLQCYHPFVDLDATQEVLSIIQKLHLDAAVESPSEWGDYRVDLGTLESISMASARRNVDLNLLVWDLVEQFGYRPTATMFEDVIMSFTATKQDKNLFSAMVDMEKNGFLPSSALLRYVAVKLSFTEKRMHFCSNLLSWKGNEFMRSTSAMNAMLIGYGMKRNLNGAFFAFEEMPRLDLQPDINTFCFLMESLYIDTKDRFPYNTDQTPKHSDQDVEDVVGAAQIILDAMEEAGLQKTKQFYYEHIRLLYSLGLFEDSKLVLEEAISIGVPVPMASIFMLTTRQAECGDFKNAWAIADLSVAAGCGQFYGLKNRLKNMESDWEYSQNRS